MDKIFDILVSKFGSDLISLAEKSYLEEPRGRYKSNPMPVIKPQNTKQSCRRLDKELTYCTKVATDILTTPSLFHIISNIAYPYQYFSYYQY